MPSQIIESIQYYAELDEATDAGKIAAAVYLSSHLAAYMLDVGAEDDTESLIELAQDVLELEQADMEHLLQLEADIQRRLDGLSA